MPRRGVSDAELHARAVRAARRMVSRAAWRDLVLGLIVGVSALIGSFAGPIGGLVGVAFGVVAAVVIGAVWPNPDIERLMRRVDEVERPESTTEHMKRVKADQVAAERYTSVIGSHRDR